MRFTTSWGDTYTSKEACFELQKFLKAIESSPDGLVDKDVWYSALNKGAKCMVRAEAKNKYCFRESEKTDKKVQKGSPSRLIGSIFSST